MAVDTLHPLLIVQYVSHINGFVDYAGQGVARRTLSILHGDRVTYGDLITPPDVGDQLRDPTYLHGYLAAQAGFGVAAEAVRRLSVGGVQPGLVVEVHLVAAVAEAWLGLDVVER